MYMCVYVCINECASSFQLRLMFKSLILIIQCIACICVFVFFKLQRWQGPAYKLLTKITTEPSIHSINRISPCVSSWCIAVTAMIKRKPTSTPRHYNVVPPPDNIVCLRSRVGMYSRSKVCPSSLTCDTSTQKDCLQSLSIRVLFSLCPLQKRTN